MATKEKKGLWIGNINRFKEVANLDAQLKKGLLEVCVLAAIKEEESYGYKIIADVSRYVEISESTLYPILKRLEATGMVTTRSKEYNGRLRKYYMITERGRQKINDFAADLEEFERIYKFIYGRSDRK